MNGFKIQVNSPSTVIKILETALLKPLRIKQQARQGCD